MLIFPFQKSAKQLQLQNWVSFSINSLFNQTICLENKANTSNQVQNEEGLCFSDKNEIILIIDNIFSQPDLQSKKNLKKKKEFYIPLQNKNNFAGSFKFL